MKLTLIAAVSENNVIGVNGDLPQWGFPKNQIPGDMKRFVEFTSNHPIIVGRISYEGFRRKPLPNRTNIVVSRSAFNDNGILVAKSIDEALKIAEEHLSEDETAYVLGGGQIYSQTIGIADRLELTRVHMNVNEDQGSLTYFPKIDSDYWKQTLCITPSNMGSSFSFVSYERK